MAKSDAYERGNEIRRQLMGDAMADEMASTVYDDPLLEKEHGGKIGALRGMEREEIQRITEARDEELRNILQRQTVSLMLKKGTVEPLMDEGSRVGDRTGEFMVESSWIGSDGAGAIVVPD